MPVLQAPLFVHPPNVVPIYRVCVKPDYRNMRRMEKGAQTVGFQNAALWFQARKIDRKDLRSPDFVSSPTGKQHGAISATLYGRGFQLLRATLQSFFLLGGGVHGAVFGLQCLLGFMGEQEPVMLFAKGYYASTGILTGAWACGSLRSRWKEVKHRLIRSGRGIHVRLSLASSGCRSVLPRNGVVRG